MTDQAILRVSELGHPWPTRDPFLVCVHHEDAYPRGNGHLGPDSPLTGRNLGSDFAGKDGWSMYHGLTIPGFPAHPHRGFETVTIVRTGFIDHADSLGAAARFGQGDVQWLTAGRGVVHSEMFPLLDARAPNPLELFQIWLNLPRRSKMAQAHFTMFWGEDVPRHVITDAEGRGIEIRCVAGDFPREGVARPLAPPPDSWASDPTADLAIWTIQMAPGARWILPPASGQETNRTLYFFKGAGVSLGGQAVTRRCAIDLRAGHSLELLNGAEPSELLLLQGRPIGEPVAQRGPFVMNSEQELSQAYADFSRTRFGGWSWPDSAPVHGVAQGRFAKHADGRLEVPSGPDSTAVRVALWRAMHVQVDPAPHVLEDEIGLRIAGPGEGWRQRPDMDPQGTRGYRAGVVGRARLIEDLVIEEADCGVTQYLILGAGLDTFAQRRPEIASKLRIFEVDQPGPQAWKRRRLMALGLGVPEWLRLVPVDFEAGESWWEKLAAAGFDPARPAVVASTGVSMYLTRSANLATLRQIAALAAGSTLAMTFLLPLELIVPAQRPQHEALHRRAQASGTPFISFFKPSEMLSLAREAGFSQTRHISTQDLIERYFAGRPDGLQPPNGEAFLVATT
jgi:quercetin 2,3-dioxygenase